MPDGPRYDDDFFAWTQHQPAVVRTMPVTDNRFDRENVADEIESLGRSERDAVRSQVRRIIEHLLKLSYSPAQDPRFDWTASVLDACAILSDKISPTLRRNVRTRMSKLYQDARRRTELGLRQYHEIEAADALPPCCPYTVDRVSRDDWHPERAGEAG